MRKKGRRTVGIIEGQGTGREVVSIFKRTLDFFADKEKKDDVRFLSFNDEFGYRPHSYLSLEKLYRGKSDLFVEKLVAKETRDLESFYKECHKKTVGLFRTAVNAEALYYVRRDIKKIKLVVLPLGLKDGPERIIFIRDQLQGYYTNDKVVYGKGSAKISLSYTDENFRTIADFVKEVVSRDRIRGFDLFFLYKFHLFGLRLQKMIEKAVKSSGLTIRGDFDIFQPDTALHILLGKLKHWSGQKDVIIVAGNEIGDVLLESLIHYYGLGTKETSCNLNMAFVDEKKRLEVLQTMHGSADDIAGKGLLNPIATLRAGAYASENWLGVPRATVRMDLAIKKAVRSKYVTRDMDGTRTTDQVTDFILSHLE